MYDKIVRERQIDNIVKYLGITGEEETMLRKEAALFPVRVPDYYLKLINKNDPDDPIRRLCLPAGPLTLTDGFLDTSGEKHNTVIPGVQHKYAETILVLCSGECAMYCRHLIYGKNTPSSIGWGGIASAAMRQYPCSSFLLK